MKKQISTILGLTALIVVFGTLSGCSCPQYADSQRTANMIKTVSSENVEILWADGHQLDGKMIIHGTLRRKTRNSVPMRAHVDVQVLSADGDVMQEVHSPDVSIPKNLPGKGVKFERFEIEMDGVVSEHSTIIISAHQGGHDA